MTEKRKIIVLTTGGTIEKTYNESDGSLNNGPSIFRERILSALRLPHFEFEIHEVLSVDSLNMDDECREYLCQAIELHLKKKCPIIVIHGTDTMDLSARYCIKNIASVDQAVIFTGAMVPTVFKGSDGLQNVCETISSSQIIKPGVYISFHGCIYEGDKCRKNKILGSFEPI